MGEGWVLVGVSLLLVRFFYEIVQTYDPGSSLFSYHPTLMILGQLVTLESIFLFKYIPRAWRVTVHGIIAGIGTCLFGCGFYAIYTNKVNLNKSHFTSWHGLLGVCTLSLMVGQSLVGTLLKYGKKLLQLVGMVRVVKVGHRVNGLVTLVLSFMVVMLVSVDWFYLVTIAIPATILITRLLLNGTGKVKKSN